MARQKKYRTTISLPSNAHTLNAVIGVSIKGEKSTGIYFRETIETLKKKCLASLNIIVSDTLYRHNIIAQQESPDEKTAIKESKKAGLKWLIDNDNAETLKSMLPFEKQGEWDALMSEARSVETDSTEEIESQVRKIISFFNVHNNFNKPDAGKKCKIWTWDEIKVQVEKERKAGNSAIRGRSVLEKIDRNNRLKEGIEETAKQYAGRHLVHNVSQALRDKVKQGAFKYILEECDILGQIAILETWHLFIYPGKKPKALQVTEDYCFDGLKRLEFLEVRFDEIKPKLKQATQKQVPQGQKSITVVGLFKQDTAGNSGCLTDVASGREVVDKSIQQCQQITVDVLGLSHMLAALDPHSLQGDQKTALLRALFTLQLSLRKGEAVVFTTLFEAAENHVQKEPMSAEPTEAATYSH